jgi:hypothetical protein
MTALAGQRLAIAFIVGATRKLEVLDAAADLREPMAGVRWAGYRGFGRGRRRGEKRSWVQRRELVKLVDRPCERGRPEVL